MGAIQIRITPRITPHVNFVGKTISLAIYFDFSEFTSLFVNYCSIINFCSNLILLMEKIKKKWSAFIKYICRNNLFNIKIYDKYITMGQFSYHTPYLPSTPISVLESRISPKAEGPRADTGFSG